MSNRDNKNLGKPKSNLKKMVVKVLKSFLRKMLLILAPIAIALIIIAACYYFIKMDDANYKEGDKSNVPYSFSVYKSNINISNDGKITGRKTAQEMWDEILENGGNIDEYLDNASELKKLMNAELVTQFMDTRSNPDEPVDWEKINSNTGSDPETREESLEIQGIVKLKRANTDGTKTTMTYVDESTYQYYIDHYNDTGDEQDKQIALSHFTIGTNRSSSSSSNSGYSLAGFTTEEFLAEVKKVADMVYQNRNIFRYGNSVTTPPCEFQDGTANGYPGENLRFISCDRLVAKALYNLGVTDQKAGGITVSDTQFLEEHGFRRIDNQSDVERWRHYSYGKWLNSNSLVCCRDI